MLVSFKQPAHKKMFKNKTKQKPSTMHEHNKHFNASKTNEENVRIFVLAFNESHFISLHLTSTFVF